MADADLKKLEREFYLYPSLEIVERLDLSYKRHGLITPYRCSWFTRSNRYNLLNQDLFNFKYWEDAASWMVKDKLHRDPQDVDSWPSTKKVALFNCVSLVPKLPGVILLRHAEHWPLVPNYLSDYLASNLVEPFKICLKYFIQLATQARIKKNYNTHLIFAELATPIRNTILSTLEAATRGGGINFLLPFANRNTAIVDSELCGLTLSQIEKAIVELNTDDPEPRRRGEIVFTEYRAKTRGKPVERLQITIRKELQRRRIEVPLDKDTI